MKKIYFKMTSLTIILMVVYITLKSSDAAKTSEGSI